MNRLSLFFILLFAGFSVAAVPGAGNEPVESPAAKLIMEAAGCRQNALDLRVLGLNALKNAEAARNKAYAALLVALGGSDAREIDKAREHLDEACGHFEDAVDEVDDLMKFVLGAEMSLGKAEVALRETANDNDSSLSGDVLDETEKQLKSARRSLGKAGSLADELKIDWLEPFFITTTTTTTSTTTTTVPAAEAVSKP